MIPSLSVLASHKPAGGGGGGLAVTLDQATISKTDSRSSITTSSVAANATGGTPPYTYQWTRAGGDSGTSATSSSANSTAFRRTGCVAGNSYVSTWICTVTDNAAATADSAALSVTITRT